MLFIVLLCNNPLKAQNHPAPFNAKMDSISFYAFPWTGGLNSCQFNSIDLNMDGIDDLLVFDRSGNRLVPFLNQGIADSVCYTYAPEYVSLLPEIADWVIVRDYNLDGKSDIFAYSAGYAGILVYKNISGQNLQFDLVVYPYLKSFQGAGYTNILVTYADYPAIEDIDGDGDLDILTFWGLGSFVEFHKNLGMENYGTPDSLNFAETQLCWGQFAESDESNELFLDTCFGVMANGMMSQLLPHTGSTFLVSDFNGDQVKDLLLGDVDYPDLYLLLNDGTSEYAHMASYTNIFPSGSRSVKLFSMPLASFLDVDNDGLKDLIVSPFDPGSETSANYQSVWFYKNTGSNIEPDFIFQTDRFLQSQTIDLGSGAYPVFFDFTGDGLTDLLVGNFGYYDSSWYDEWLFLRSHYTSKIAAFQNIGNEQNPVFQLVDTDYGSYSKLNTRGLIPAFADLDSDGDEDMILGCENGSLFFAENIAGSGDSAVFIITDSAFQDIDVGNCSAPQLFDLNRDGLKDLIIGEKNGNLNYYQNSGGSSPVFNFITDSLGYVMVTDFNVSYYGYSTPAFFYDSSGIIRLVVGSEQGRLFYYHEVEDNLSGRFTESGLLYQVLDTVPLPFNEGMRSAAAIGDINGDGLPEMFAGNYSGGLRLYARNNVQVSPWVEKIRLAGPEIVLYPVPATNIAWFSFSGVLDYECVNLVVYDASGSALLKKSFSPETDLSINTTILKNGVYFVQFAISLKNNRKILVTDKMIISR